MPVFNYVAKDNKGEYHRGEVETADDHEAARLLQRKKLIIISTFSSLRLALLLCLPTS